MGEKREPDDEEMSTSEDAKDEEEIVDDEEEENKEAESEQSQQNDALIPFMDTFYSLSSNDPSQRSIAASSLLSYLFLSSSSDGSGDGNSDDVDIDSIVKDGFYALTRLLKGLCSGRASARQGFASCLATFLKLSFKLGPTSNTSSEAEDDNSKWAGKCWMDCFMDHYSSSTENKQEEKEDDGDEEELSYNSSSEFVRFKMVKTTSHSRNMSSSKRRKGGSEERDYNFGQLFGILAVVRSGILMGPFKDMKVVQGYIQDLLNLYHHKNWMREPSIRALQELFSYIAHHSFESLDDLIQDTLGSFFTHDNNDGDQSQGGWTAEKITLYLHLQTLYMDQGNDEDITLPTILNKSIISVSALKERSGNDDDIKITLTNMLRDTSKVTFPRCHLVWDAIWSYLTVSPNAKSQKGKKHMKTQKEAGSFSYKGHVLREKLVVTDESPEDILTVIVNQVVVHGLLGESSSAGEKNDDNVEETTQTDHNSTNERRALALSLLYQLCPMNLPHNVMESVVLQPVIVTKLFIKTLQKGGKNPSHTLQPLALTILNNILASIEDDSAHNDKNVERKLVIIRSMLRAHPSFDSITRTRTVASLLSLEKKCNSTDKNEDGKESGGDVDNEAVWEHYLDFLEQKILDSCLPDKQSLEGLPKFIDLLLDFAKQMARIDKSSVGDVLSKRVLTFFFIGGFFDLQDIKLKTKKKKKKQGGSCMETLQVLKVIKDHLTSDDETVTPIPLALRTILSAKFHSLLADITSVVSKSEEDQQVESKSEKCLSIFSFIRSGWDTLEKHGATTFCKIQLQGQIISEEDGSSSDSQAEDLRSAEICSKVIKQAQTLDDSANAVKKKAITGISCLILSLHLQLLSPGESDSFDDVNMDDDEDEGDIQEEVNDMISGLSNILSELDNDDPNLESTEMSSDGEDNTDELNALGTLAAMSVSLFNSSLGGSGVSLYRAGGTKLVRDCAKLAWTGGLHYANKMLSSDTPTKFSLDVNAMNVLLESVCGSEHMEDEEMDMEDEELEEIIPMDMDDESSTDNEEQNDDTSVTDEGKDDGSQEENDKEDDMEEDLELDPSKLESLLLEDIESEEEIDLEHHEGADAALAQLIKIKQEARKTGRTKRERTELSNRLRCMMLLETVFTPSHLKSSLLSNQTILMVILPLLRTTRQLHRSIIKVNEGSDHSSIGDRRALVDKITNLLQGKICKSNLNGTANMESCTTLAENVKVELKKVKNAKYVTCCSSLLALTIKAVSNNFEDAVKLAEIVYVQAVEEWSKKNSTAFTFSIFADFIERIPRVARAVMIEPLIRSTNEARSSFLRVESFTLLSALYNIPKQNTASQEEIKSLQDAIPSISKTVSTACSDEDMTKSKRFRLVLQATEIVTKFALNHSSLAVLTALKELREPLQSVSDDTSSEPIKKLCSTIITNVKNELEKESKNEKKDVPTSSKKKKKKSKRGKKK